MKPIILITHKSNVNTGDRSVGKLYQIQSNYCRAVIRAGGIPIVTAMAEASDYAEIADGLLITGGINDIESVRYREENRKCANCDFDIDQMEFALFEAFYKKNKPIFGVCRGMQLINVALGGSLYQDIATDIDKLTVHAVSEGDIPVKHPVHAARGSMMCELFGEDFCTNSHHHQAIKTCGKGLKVTVTTEEDLIEAIEHEELPIFGTQWHPERMIGEENFDLDNMMPLFTRFVEMCKK